MLEIKMFGSFAVQRDGASLCTHWKRSANRLLALLTLNHNRSVSATWAIASLMMPETVFPQSVKELREVLGPEDRNRIKHASHQIHFDTSGVQVDMFVFDKLIQRGTQESYETAVRIYKGGMLRDWEEDSWFSEERENCLLGYLDAIDFLAKDALANKDFGRAASFLRLHVSAYPEMDSAWIRLAQVYITSGEIESLRDMKSQYLASLSKRSAEEGRRLEPSVRLLNLCDSHANTVEISPKHGGTELPRGTAIAPMPADAASSSKSRMLEPVGGVVLPESPFYLVRDADIRAREAVERKDSFVMIKGARQVGKSSLIAQLMRSTRASGARVVRSDWQKLPRAALETAETFLAALAETVAEDLELENSPNSHFVSTRAATACFESFLRKDVFRNVSGQIVLFIDEADRLFETPYRDDVFALMRSWHGERAFDMSGHWNRFTVVIAYATEAHLFIKNLAQSPFNVGTRIELGDFSLDEVTEMNRRYGSPLSTEPDVAKLYELVGGHPYLVRRCLHELVTTGSSIAELRARVQSSDTLFNDHLGRMRLALLQDTDLLASLREYLSNGSLPLVDDFVRLRSSGLVMGESPRSMSLRCRLYEIYLRRNLL